MKKTYLFIDNEEKLQLLRDAATVSRYVALDTEFVRRTTYFAQLALIQIKADDQIFLIDPLVFDDLSYIKELMLDESITKILHAPQQDFEIFYHLFKETPENIFDTQIAARLCGLGQFISYRDLCKELLGVDIDKSLQKCDWGARPITEAMCQYAASDVDNLSHIYEILYNMLRTNEKMKDFQHEMELISDKQKYIIDFSQSWKKVKCSNRNRRFTARLQQIAAYREETAAQLNVPRGHFITDKELISLCYNLPQDHKSFKKTHFSSKWMKDSKLVEQIIDLCNAIADKESTA